MKIKFFSFIIMLLVAMSSCNRGKRHIPTGLALSGGGAKCAAEIGVLEVIDSLDIEIDYIAGSSMGAVVGGLYAAGYSAKEIRQMWLEEDWLRLFKTGNEAEGFLGVEVVDADGFETILREKLADARRKKGRKKRIKFACTATEIIDETSVKGTVLSEKDMDLARAIRASMTYPVPLVGDFWGYAPIEANNIRYVDGGMTNNYPVDVVKSMGAKKIIAVDLNMKNHYSKPTSTLDAIHLLSRELFPRLEFFEDVFDCGWLVQWYVTRPDIDMLEANRALKDVIYIKPVIDGYNFLSFSKEDTEEMIFQGKYAAKKKLIQKRTSTRTKKRKNNRL